MNQLIVLGGGSAGFLAAITCKTRLPNLNVTLLRSPEIGIIGVGEGTTPVVLTHLHGYLRLNPAEFFRLAQPTWKLGIRFLWGPREYFNYTFSFQYDAQVQGLPRRNGFYCDDDCRHADVASTLMSHDRVFLRQPNGSPLIGKDVAYHLENETLVAFLESVARAQDVRIIEDTVRHVEQEERGVQALQLESGGRLEGDFFVDASGFRSLLLGKTLGEPFESFASTLLCDTAVVGGWQRGDEPLKPYTTAATMNAGWCWQIEHEQRINRGYVYASPYVSDEEAEAEFRRQNPAVETTRVVRFKSGRYRRAWVKNVFAIGNAAGFVEPLESTSLGVICDDAQALAETLADCELRPTPSLAEVYNDRSRRVWESIRDFLAVHYRFNTRLDTPFWRDCREKVPLHGAQRVVNFFQQNGPSTTWKDFLVDRVDQFRMEGYLSLLIGQKVPFARRINVTEEEWALWRRYREQLRTQVQQALTLEEALALVRSPHWQWTPGFYDS